MVSLLAKVHVLHWDSGDCISGVTPQDGVEIA
jgi:hypothetical protein